VLAVGVVLWTGSAQNPRFLLLQNSRHHSWGLAKGHAEGGESLMQTALREVAEETGFTLAATELHPSFADSSVYQVAGEGWKRVIYFLSIHPVDANNLRCSEEHQESRWATLEEACTILTYSDLRRTLHRAASCLQSPPHPSLP